MQFPIRGRFNEQNRINWLLLLFALTKMSRYKNTTLNAFATQLRWMLYQVEHRIHYWRGSCAESTGIKFCFGKLTHKRLFCISKQKVCIRLYHPENFQYIFKAFIRLNSHRNYFRVVHWNLFIHNIINANNGNA